MLKSYYEILNVKSNASKSEIKKQYKKLVKMYHPDINSSFEAEKVFKEISNAAEILLDDKKRKEYDFFRAKTIDEIKPKKEEKNTQTLKPQKGDDITVFVEINYQEAFLGVSKVINISNSIVCPKCQGRKFANGRKCQYCNGLGEYTENKKITLKIPASVKNNTKLRLKYEGKKGINGGLNGNLYAIIRLYQDDNLKIKDGVVYYNAFISPYSAVLGGSIKIPTLWGQTSIILPPLTKTNQSFKLIDVGILDKKTGKKGDEVVNIFIQIPKNLSQEEIQLYQKLREINLKKKNGKYI